MMIRCSIAYDMRIPYLTYAQKVKEKPTKSCCTTSRTKN